MTLDTISDFLHKPLLELIHHNTKSLDGLLDECVAALHARFHPGEHVVCKEHNSSSGIVLGLSVSENACHSPSCDKENNLVSYCSSPRLLPLNYRVLLKQTKVELSDVAYSDLSRVECLPSREAIALFVSLHASREPLSTCHTWVVSSTMIAKHALKNKIAPMFLPLSERKRAQQEQTKADQSRKRKSSSGKPTSAKKTKISRKEKSSGNRSSGADDCLVIACVSPSSQSTLNSCTRIVPTKKLTNSFSDSVDVLKADSKSIEVSNQTSDRVVSAKNHVSDVVLVDETVNDDDAVVIDDDDDEVFVDGKVTDNVDTQQRDSDDSDNVTLIKIAKTTSKIDALRKKVEEQRIKKQKSRRAWRERQKQLKNQLAMGDKKKQRTLSKTTDAASSSVADATTPKINGKAHHMRQISLFDMSKHSRSTSKSSSGGGTKQRQVSRSSDVDRPLPPCVLKLSKLLDSGRRVGPHNYLLLMCLRMLHAEQVERIEHEATRQLLRHRLQLAEERKQLAKLSVEERQEFLKNKRLEERRQRNMRYDDQSLPDLSSLPDAQPVSVPDGLPNSAFGQLAMVAEFVNSHWSLLAPTVSDNSQPPITTHTLMYSLLADADSAPYRQFGELVTMLLRTLLKDDAFESFCELGVPVFSLPITPQTAGELCRMCLRHAARDDADSDSEADTSDVQLDETCEQLVDLLETGELHELSPVQRLQLLEWFVQELLASNSLAAHVEQQEERLRSLNTHRNNIVRERRAKAPPAAATSADPEPPAADPEPQLTEECEVSSSGRVRRSLRNVEEARRDREAKEKEAKEKRLQQIEDSRREKQEHQVMEDHAAATRSHASLVRRAPLGLDRNHRRYWLLQSAEPFALYVETGWAGPDTVPIETVVKSNREGSEDDDKPLALMREQKEEVSFPAPGQNMWFYYKSMYQVAQLIDALAERGRRESALKEALQAVHDTIKEGFSRSSLSESNENVDEKPKEDENVHKKSKEDETTIPKQVATTDVKEEVADENPAPADHVPASVQDGAGHLLTSLREDLLGVEQELSAGLLGGIAEHADRDTWRQQVTTADTAPLLAPLLLRCFQCIPARSLRPPLAPEPSVHETPTTPQATTTAEPARSACRAEQWCAAVKQCVTLSRLHVLVGVLDTSVRWNLSSAQKKCRTCRRAGGGEYGEAAVCPKCTHLYHWRCVRPRLYEAPEEDWLCPGCTPREQRASSRRQPLARQDKSEEEDVSDGEEGESDQAEMKETLCRVCQSDAVAELIVCPQCPAAFHKQCHEPPVTLRIRAGWECMDCKVQQAVRGRRKGAKAPLPSTVLRQARQAADSDEDNNASDEEGPEEEEEDESEEEEQQPQVEVRRSRTKRTSRRRSSFAVERRSSGRTAPRNYRAMASDSETEDSDAEEARIRALSTDDDDEAGDTSVGVRSGGGRQACWVMSSPARQRQIRAQRRRMRSSPPPLPLKSDSDGE